MCYIKEFGHLKDKYGHQRRWSGIELSKESVLNDHSCGIISAQQEALSNTAICLYILYVFVI